MMDSIWVYWCVVVWFVYCFSHRISCPQFSSQPWCRAQVWTRRFNFNMLWLGSMQRHSMFRKSSWRRPVLWTSMVVEEPTLAGFGTRILKQALQHFAFAWSRQHRCHETDDQIEHWHCEVLQNTSGCNVDKPIFAFQAHFAQVDAGDEEAVMVSGIRGAWTAAKTAAGWT